MLRLKTILIFCLPLLVFAQNSDQVFEQRLESISTAIPLTYNSFVRNYINDYVRNDKAYTSSALARLHRDKQMIEEILTEYQLPLELKYLALSLSGCSNFESSEEGGTGYYLMRYSIAKNKGLHISSYVDERRDQIKATRALAQELKELQSKYNDWHKTISAYFSSSLELDRAISYSKDSLKRYWQAHSYLPFRYQKTVSKFIAAVYIDHFYKEHNILVASLPVIETDTVPIRQLTTITQVSERLEVDFEQLKSLNPTYKRQIIPNSGRDYFLVIPADKVEQFYALGDSVYLSEEELQDTVPIVKVEPVPQPEYTAIYYKVRSGDMLLNIADYYDTRVSNIKRWNNLRSDRINVNQKLKIMVPTKRLSYYKKISGLSRAEKRRIANKD